MSNPIENGQNLTLIKYSTTTDFFGQNDDFKKMHKKGKKYGNGIKLS